MPRRATASATVTTGLTGTWNGPLRQGRCCARESQPVQARRSAARSRTGWATYSLLPNHSKGARCQSANGAHGVPARRTVVHLGDSMSRIDRPRTIAPITIARSGSVQHLRAARKQPGDERLGGLADLRDLDLEFAHQRLQRARAINLAPSLASSDSDSCGFSPTPRPTTARSAPQSPPTAVRCVSRRRSSFNRLAGHEGTYAVALTAPRPFTAVRRRDPRS
jgi:hypothetical protein